MKSTCGVERTAFITGCFGQDGLLLSSLLLKRGYRVYGSVTEHKLYDISFEFGLKQDLKIEAISMLNFFGLKLLACELTDIEQTTRILEALKPDEIYHLAAISSVSLASVEPEYCFYRNIESTFVLMEAVKCALDRSVPIFNAGSSELFDGRHGEVCNEDTLASPRSVYGFSKLASKSLVDKYKNAFELNIRTGIMFNHESPLRSDRYVSTKICSHVRNFRNNDGRSQPLFLGDISSSRDWSSAADVVVAQWLINQHEMDDYVIGSGISNTVQQFAETAFTSIGVSLYWDIFNELPVARLSSNFNGMTKDTIVVATDRSLVRERRDNPLISDAQKLRTHTGWSPVYTFEEMINQMVEVDSRHKFILSLFQ